VAGGISVAGVIVHFTGLALYPGSLVGMLKWTDWVPANTLDSWIAAANVHSVTPSLLVPPVSQTLSPGTTSEAFPLELTTKGPDATTVTAAEASECLVMTRWDFTAELKSGNSSIALAILPELSKVIRRLEGEEIP